MPAKKTPKTPSEPKMEGKTPKTTAARKNPATQTAKTDTNTLKPTEKGTNEMTDMVNDLKERAETMAKNAQETVNKVSADATETAGKVVGEVSEAAAKVADQVKDTATKAADQVKETAETVREKVGEAFGKETPIGGFMHHQRLALDSLWKAFQALIPEDFKAHSAEARKQFIEAFQALISGARSALEKMEQEDKAADANAEDRPSTTGKNKVKVELD
ncbi:MAG TPA: hypothetical protein PLD47_13650 [Aggregatilineales bacterium]|nr:hypothetical protein [Anaerolineales bacterium]HRE48765.1 hypothetical protein [Aggregatilineales bacterium]